MKIVPDLPTGAYRGALGFALSLARFGIDVEVVYRRIELQAENDGVRTEVVLAYAIAHEIGHVLLRSSTHSSAGIMQARPNEESWRLASLGLMEFLTDEAAQMRKGLRQLTGEEEARSRSFADTAN